MKRKSILLVALFSIFSMVSFSQEVKDVKDKNSGREIELKNFENINELIGVKADQEVVDYKISLVNKGESQVYIWTKGTFDETRIMEMIGEKRSSNSMLYIEEIKVRNSNSDKILDQAAIKVRLK